MYANSPSEKNYSLSKNSQKRIIGDHFVQERHKFCCIITPELDRVELKKCTKFHIL